MIDAVLDALGHGTRRRILEVLTEGEQPAGSVVEAVQARVPISQPAVSQHLKVLRDAGLVRVRTDGSRRLYAIEAAGIDATAQWLALLVDGAGRFDQPLDALATEVARGKRERSRRSAAPAHRPRTA